MMRRLPTPPWFALIAGSMVTAALGSPIAAQSPDACAADVRGGVSIPVGELGEVWDSGFHLGLGLSCRVNSTVRVFAGLELSSLDSNVALYHLLAGPRITLAESGSNGWGAGVGFAAGWTIVDNTGVSFGGGFPSREGRLKSSFTLGADLRLLRSLGSNLNVYVASGLRALLVNSEDVVKAGQTVVEGFGVAVVAPISAGIEVTL